jgi:hypothetical protein
MMRSLTAVGAMLGVLLAAPLAKAQGRAESFGEKGQFIIGADRLFDLFAFTSVSANQFGPPPGVTKIVTTDTQTSMGLLWGSSEIPNNTPNGSLYLTNFYTVPRVGFDYTIVNNVTVGGELIVWFTLGGHESTETDNNNGSSTTTTTGRPGQATFGIAPRGGYILQLSDMFSLWLRGGFSIYSTSTNTSNTANGVTTSTSLGAQQFAIDLDPQFVFTPMRHVGFTAGLTADIPIGGGHWSNTTISGNNTTITQNSSLPQSIAFFGVTVGTLVWF